jgi:hypothetical protein
METRKEDVERIHEQMSQDGYRIDADAVAEAILCRLAAGRTLRFDRRRAE